jgi:hypothetical protein
MLRRYQPKVGLAAVMIAAVMLVAAYGATAAQAAEGPNWLFGPAPGKVLAAGEKLSILSESQGTVTLNGIVTVTCKSLQNKGELFGGKPGTDLEELEFLECALEKKTVAECAASSGATKGIINTNILTALAYPLEGEAGNVAYDAVFPDGSNELFVVFTFEGTNCGLLNKAKAEVLAIGKPLIKTVNNEAFEAQCGELGELGILNSGGTFETVGPGVLEENGVIKFPAENAKKEVVHSAALFFNGKFEPITCELEVNSLLSGKATEAALVLVEAFNKGVKVSLGWEH